MENSNVFNHGWKGPVEKERRASSRETLSQPLGVRPVGSLPGDLMDLSSRGAAITSMIAVPRGTSVQLSLLGNSINISGTVKNLSALQSGGFRLGLEFHQVHAGLSELLTKASRFQQ